MVKDTILYDRLGVSSTASDKELKKAYHKLSMKWHPDKNNSDEAKEKFQDISEAYSILSDKEKRNIYDQVGIEMTKNGGQAPVDPADIFKHFMGSMGGFPFGSSGFGSSGFGEAFGGGFGGNPFGGAQGSRNRDTENYENCVVQLDVSLEELYNEATVRVNYKQKCYCKNCNGNGTKDGSKSECSKCNGSGKATIVRQMGNMIQQITRTCPDCNGTGENVASNNRCEYCNGSKFKVKDRGMDFKLNKKFGEGNNITIKEKGNIYKKLKTDLIIVIKEKDHPVFTRIDDDLHILLNIKLYQLIFGLNTSIKHLDGRNLFVNINKIDVKKLDDDILYSIKNEGLRNNGSLIIHLNVENVNTSKLEENEKTILKKLLVKCDIEEFKKEVGLLKDKDNLVKTNVKKYVMSNNSRSNTNSSPNRFNRNEFNPNNFPPGFDPSDFEDAPGGCATQ